MESEAPPQMQNQLAGSEELRGDLPGSSDRSQPRDEITDDREARHDFFLVSGR